MGAGLRWLLLAGAVVCCQAQRLEVSPADRDAMDGMLRQVTKENSARQATLASLFGRVR